MAAGGAALMVEAWLAASASARDDLMPEFASRSPDAWINSQPLSRKDLQGSVVLLEIYASG